MALSVCLLLLAACAGTIAQLQAISEPNDVVICEGGSTTLTCVLSTADADVEWYRFNKNTGSTEIEGLNGHITINKNMTSYSLTITNAKESLTGYYWVKGLSTSVCNTSVTVVTSPPALTVNITKNTESLSIVVQWDEVDDSLPTTYTVTWTSERDLNNVQVKNLEEQSSHTITGLTLDTVYTITVTANNRCGTGPEYSTAIKLSNSTTSSISPTSTIANSAATSHVLDPSSLVATSTVSPGTTTNTNIPTFTTATTSMIIVTSPGITPSISNTISIIMDSKNLEATVITVSPSTNSGFTTTAINPSTTTTTVPATTTTTSSSLEFPTTATNPTTTATSTAPTVMNTATSDSVSPTPSNSMSPTPSNSVSPTPSDSMSPTLSSSVSPTPSDSMSPTPSSSVSPTPSDSMSPTPSSSVSPIPSTPSDSVSPTPSDSVSPMPSDSVSPTLSNSVSPTPTSDVGDTADQDDNGFDIMDYRYIAAGALGGLILFIVIILICCCCCCCRRRRKDKAEVDSLKLNQYTTLSSDGSPSKEVPSVTNAMTIMDEKCSEPGKQDADKTSITEADFANKDFDLNSQPLHPSDTYDKLAPRQPPVHPTDTYDRLPSSSTFDQLPSANTYDKLPPSRTVYNFPLANTRPSTSSSSAETSLSNNTYDKLPPTPSNDVEKPLLSNTYDKLPSTPSKDVHKPLTKNAYDNYKLPSTPSNAYDKLPSSTTFDKLPSTEHYDKLPSSKSIHNFPLPSIPQNTYDKVPSSNKPPSPNTGHERLPAVDANKLYQTKIEEISESHDGSHFYDELPCNKRKDAHTGENAYQADEDSSVQYAVLQPLPTPKNKLMFNEDPSKLYAQIA